MSWIHNCSHPLRPVVIVVLAALSLGAGTVMAQSGQEQFHYLQYCSACHLVDGSGVPPEVPNLRLDLGKLLETVEGRDYMLRVQGVTEVPLADQDMTNLLNWIIRAFYPDLVKFRPFTVEEVQKGRARPLYDPIKYREEMFPDLY